MWRSLVCGRNGHDAATTARRERHRARATSEQRVVLAEADAVARLETRAALANDDLAAGHDLSSEDLHAEALGVRVAAVPARSESLLMSHPRPPSWYLASSRPASSPPASWPQASWRPSRPW